MSSDRVKIEVEGLPLVLGQLRAVDRKVKRKILRKATTAAAKELHAEARRLSPRVNGFLRQSLKVVVRSGKSAVFAKIGQEKNRKFKRKRFKGSNINRRGYAAPIWWIERGTKAHEIRPISGKAVAWSAGKRKGSKGKMIFARSVRNPGMKAGRLLERASRIAGLRASRVWFRVAAEELAKVPPATEAAS